MRKLLISAFCGLFLVGCNEPQGALYPEHIKNVTGVLVREPRSYTFFVQEPGSTQIKTEDVWVRGKDDAAIFADVSDGQGAWVLLHKDAEGRVWRCEIHVHSMADMGAGGYRVRSGKSSRLVQPQFIE